MLTYTMGDREQYCYERARPHSWACWRRKLLFLFQDKDRNTVLHPLATRETGYQIHLILEKKDDVSIWSKDGVTALLCAVHAGHEDIIWVFLKAGADTSASPTVKLNYQAWSSVVYVQGRIEAVFRKREVTTSSNTGMKSRNHASCDKKRKLWLLLNAVPISRVQADRSALRCLILKYI